MGSEMGNNNTSGLQEEYNASHETEQKSAQEPSVHANDVKGENHQKETGLASDDPRGVGDTPAYDQISDIGKGQEKTDVNPPAESPKAGKELHKEGSEDGDFQLAASMSKESEDSKIPISLENVLEMSNNGIGNWKHSSLGKEEEDMLNSTSVLISSSQDPESEDSAEPNFDQHEFNKVHAEESEEDSTNSTEGIEDDLGSNIACNNEDDDDLLDNHVSGRIEETIVSDTKTDMGMKKDDLLEKEMAFEVEFGNGDIREKYVGELDSKINCYAADTLKSQLEANLGGDSSTSHLEDKCMVLDQETKLIVNESEVDQKTELILNEFEVVLEQGIELIVNESEAVLDQETELIVNESECGENELHLKSVTESEVDMQNASQTDSLTRPNCNEGSLLTVHDAASNGNCDVEEVKVVEESDDQNKASEEHFNASEGKIMMAYKSREFPAEVFIINGKSTEQESGDCIPEAYTARDAATSDNYQVVGANGVEEPDNQNEASEGKLVMVPEIEIKESGDCKPEAYTALDAATSNNYQVVGANGAEEPDNQNEASEGKLVVVPEIEIKESGDCKPEAYTALDAATSNNYRVVDANGVEEPDNWKEASEGKLVMVPEIETKESQDCKPEAYTARDAATSNNYRVVEANGVEEPDNHNEASEGKLVMVPEIETKELGDCKPKAYTASDAATSNNYQVVEANGVKEPDNQNEASEGKLVMVPEIEIKESGVCKPEAYTAHDAATSNNYRVVEANGVEEPDNQNEASEGKLVMVPEIETKESGDCKPKAYTASDAATSNNYRVVEVNGVEEPDNQNESSEGKLVMVPKIETKELGDCKPEAYTARDAATGNNYQVVEANGVGEPDNQNEASEGNLVMVPEIETKESGDCKPKAYTASGAATSNNYRVLEANGVEEPDNQNEASEGKLVMVPKIETKESGDCKPEAYMARDAATGNNYRVVEANGIEEPDNQNEASEGKLVMVPEIEIKESGDCKPEAYTALDVAISNNYRVVEANGVEEADNRKEASEGKRVVVPENETTVAKSSIAHGKSNEEESVDCKSEACEEKSVLCPQLATVTAELPIKNEEESDNCKAEEEEPKEKQSMEIREKTETECTPASMHLCEDNQQTPEDVQGGSSEFFTAAVSIFHASSFPVETFVSAVELELEKPVEEVLPNVTQTNSSTSASANHSMKKPENFEISVVAGNDIEPIPQTSIQAELQNFPTSTIKIIVSAAQQEKSPHYNTAVKENRPTEQIEKAETSIFAGASQEPQESVGRFSTESIPDSLNIHAEMRKSPSFNLNLRIEARSEKSDMTPLLYQDKNTIEGLSNQDQASNGNLQDPLLQAQYSQGSVKCQEMPVEEKVTTLERSDSEKSRTPFLGFLKENEEPHHLVVIPKKQDKKSAAKKGTNDQWNSSCNKEITPTPAKGKHKHKRRSSLFTNCMCCTTVIN